MPKPNLRAVDPKVEHPLDIARRRVKEYLKPEKPIVNIHAPEGAPTLVVDEVLEKSMPDLIGKKAP